MKRSKESAGFVRSLQKGLACLATFSPQRPVLTLSQVARANSLGLPTARRYLHTLVELGYLVHDSDARTFQLTPKVLRLGSWVIQGMDLKSRALPHMHRITRAYNVTTGCVILDGTEVIYVERLRSADVVNLDLTAGSRLPVHCTSLGKAILAFLPETERDAILNEIEFVQNTPWTIRDKVSLLENIQEIKRRGLAFANQELTVGMNSIAAPIFGKNGEVTASIGISYPVHREEDKTFRDCMTQELVIAAEQVSIAPPAHGISSDVTWNKSCAS